MADLRFMVFACYWVAWAILISLDVCYFLDTFAGPIEWIKNKLWLFFWEAKMLLYFCRVSGSVEMGVLKWL